MEKEREGRGGGGGEREREHGLSNSNIVKCIALISLHMYIIIHIIPQFASNWFAREG